MRKILAHALFLIFIAPAAIAATPSTATSCTADTECAENQYCDDDGQCQSCPNGYTNHDKTTPTGQKGCYKKCGNKPNFTNGKWLPTALTAYHPNKCEYKALDINSATFTSEDPADPVSITVYTASNIDCNNSPNCAGYHLECTSETECECVPNKIACTTQTGTGYRFLWTKSKGEPYTYTACAINECTNPSYTWQETDESLRYETGNICQNPSVAEKSGTCVIAEILCSPNNGLAECKYNDADGNIPNNFAPYVPKTSIDGPAGHYDYSKCSCTVKAPNGVGTITGTYSEDGQSIGNWTSDITGCDHGYCKPNGAIDCIETPNGYYSMDNEVTCTPCPMGMTSNGGNDATSSENCYMKAGETRICNKSNRCFTLPTDIGAQVTN